MLREWYRGLQEKREKYQETAGWNWAYSELLAGRETAQSIDLFVDKSHCNPFERGAIRAMWFLISKKIIKDTTL